VRSWTTRRRSSPSAGRESPQGTARGRAGSERRRGLEVEMPVPQILERVWRDDLAWETPREPRAWRIAGRKLGDPRWTRPVAAPARAPACSGYAPSPLSVLVSRRHERCGVPPPQALESSTFLSGRLRIGPRIEKCRRNTQDLTYGDYLWRGNTRAERLRREGGAARRTPALYLAPTSPCWERWRRSRSRSPTTEASSAYPAASSSTAPTTRPRAYAGRLRLPR